MIKYRRKVSVFNVNESWFTYTSNFWDIFSLNVYRHLKNCDHKHIRGIKDVTHTLEVNLEHETTTILYNFSKQIRQQARIAENEGTTCYFHNDIDQFVLFFNDFARRKKTFPTSKQMILGLGDSVKLSFAVNNGQILAAHSYLLDPEIGIVRHLHSATKRLDENVDTYLVGRANKYMTVKNILCFKEMGFKIFDFGGYANDKEDESLKGINNYKLLFGGKVVTSINYYSYNYWVLKKISKFFGLSGKL